MTRVAINGLGRTGRQAIRAMRTRNPDLELVAVNDVADAEELAYLLLHDSTYGRYPGDLSWQPGALLIDGHEVRVFGEPESAHIPWAALGIDVILEATGRFTDRARAAGHLAAGASRVHHLRSFDERRRHDRPRSERTEL